MSSASGAARRRSSTSDLLHTLALDGWRFWLEEGRLRYHAPKTAATGHPGAIEAAPGCGD